MEAATPRPGPVVVGYDGSAGSRTALVWAAREAERRDVPIEVVIAAHVGGMPEGAAEDAIVPDTLAAMAKEREADAGRLVSALLPEGRCSIQVVVGEPAEALLDASATAALCVVGSRGHGPVTRLLTGSVAGSLATHSPCPVVVVRGETAREDQPVVVGVDGTAASGAAVDFAAAAAHDRGVPLVVLSAWALPVQTQWEYRHWRPDLMAEWSRTCRAAAASAAKAGAARARQASPGLDVRIETLSSPPALALRDASDDASLLVVGSRGLSPMARFVVGSVGHAMVQTAHCPVVVCRS